MSHEWVPSHCRGASFSRAKTGVSTNGSRVPPKLATVHKLRCARGRRRYLTISHSIILCVCCGHLRSIRALLGLFSGSFGALLELFWGLFEALQRLFGALLGLFWGSVRALLGLFWSSFAKEHYKRGSFSVESVVLNLGVDVMGVDVIEVDLVNVWWGGHELFMMMRYDTFHWIATPPQSTKSRTSNFSVSHGTNSNRDFGLMWISTEEFEFLDLVGFGGVAYSVEAKITSSLYDEAVTSWQSCIGSILSRLLHVLWHVSVSK